MQYAVPQFTDVEELLIGPLTLKQFLSLLATGGVVMFFWSLLGLSVFFFAFAIPVSLLGLTLSFGKFNDRPVYIYVFPFLNFVTRPQSRIFKREEPMVFMKKTEISNDKLQISKIPEEPTESRLKKLAYLLDQKVHEEEELIHVGY